MTTESGTKVKDANPAEGAHPQEPPLSGEPDPLTFEITKILLANTLDYTKSVNQTMQTLTSLLLTSYIALYVALGKQYGFFKLSPVITALPVVLFLAALTTTFARASSYRGSEFHYGDRMETLQAYENAVRERRRQAIVPGMLTLLGLVSFAVVVSSAV